MYINFKKYIVKIFKVNPKMIMTLVAALAHISNKGKQEEMPDISHKTDTQQI